MKLLRGWVSVWLCCIASTAGAAGSIKTDINGNPLYWEGPVVFNPEHGELKEGVFNHEASVRMVQDAFDAWLSIPGVSLEAERGEPLPDGGDVNEANFAEYLSASALPCYDNNPDTPCLTPVVFDEDGEIIDAIYGECARFNLLAFAGFQDNTDFRGLPEHRILKKGQALFSGACIEPLVRKDGCGPCSRVLSDEDIRAMMIHEIGHLLGMDHAQVNPASYETCAEQGSCPRSLQEDIPTMFPVLVEGANQASLHQDDIQYFLRLYGEEDPLQSSCSVSGTVYEHDGSTPLRGVEVVARNVDPQLERSDALAFVSGSQAPRNTLSGSTAENCKGDCGNYLITGLTAGETYKLCAQKIQGEFTGGSGMEPVDPPLQGFSDGCVEEISVQCLCDAKGCLEFSQRNIITDYGDATDSSHLTEEVQTSASGGCSLAKPILSTQAWKKMLRATASFFPLSIHG